MSKESKHHFILRKKHLSIRELSAQTGLTEPEVVQILKAGGPEDSGDRPIPSFLQDKAGTLWVCSLLLALVVILYYLPVLGNDFVNWDDMDTIANNVLIRHLNWDSIKGMFVTFPGENWIPLTWLSFAFNFRFGGLDPRIFHATNVFFHALNTVLVFWVSFRVIKKIREIEPAMNANPIKGFVVPIAFLTALLFGLHPIHVESVAWATERKDVLYSFFYLGALSLYLCVPFPLERMGPRYGACLGLYLLALMSKPMAITLPFIFLILDGWPLGRWKLGAARILKEKAAFFVLAFGAIGITVVSHQKTFSYAKGGVEFYWIMNSFRSLMFYLLKMVWPQGLTAYYPFPPELNGFYLFENFCAAAAVILLSLLLVRNRAKTPYLLAAWAYYVVVLLPVIGLIQTGSQAAADRYTYLASLGVCLPLAAGAARLVSYRWVPFAIGSAAIVALLGFETLTQIGTWKNSQALWERVTRVYPDENPTAYSKLGAAYLKARRYDEAVEVYSRAASIPPPLATTFNGLGTALLYKDRPQEAVGYLEYALKLDPLYNAARINLWKYYEHQERHEEAGAQMEAALKIEPNSPVLHNNLGVSLVFLKKNKEAWTSFEEAHRLDPDNPEYLVNLATIDLWGGLPEKALQWYREGIARHPREPVYYLKMADIYITQGSKAKALKDLLVAWDLNPVSPKVVQQIGEDFEKLGRADRAQECFAKAKALSSKTQP